MNDEQKQASPDVTPDTPPAAWDQKALSLAENAYQRSNAHAFRDRGFHVSVMQSAILKGMRFAAEAPSSACASDMLGEFKKGFTDPVGDCGKFEASIDVGAWGARIAVFGDTPADAEQLRDVVFAAITAPQPPALGGDLVVVGTLHRDCDERIVFESSGEFHVKDGMPVYSDDSVAPLQAENTRLELMVAQYDHDTDHLYRERDQLKVEIERLKSEAEENHKEREVICANYDQLKADLAERWEQIAELNSEAVQLKARNAELEGLLDRVVDHANFWRDHPYAEVVESIAKDYKALSKPAGSKQV